MYICKYCNKEFDKLLNGKNHEKQCPKNKNRILPKNYRKRLSIEIEIDDNNKLHHKYLNKRNNAKKEDIEFLLTYEEFCQLVKKAGLKSSQLGFSGEKYVLARYEDKGSYSINNCRFITQSENAKEKHITEKSREASRKNAEKLNSNKIVLSNLIRRGQQESEHYQNRLKQLTLLRQQKNEDKNKSNSITHLGVKNSQYGTFWITDGVVNKKWKQDMGSIPTGFYQGRVGDFTKKKCHNSNPVTSAIIKEKDPCSNLIKE